jgi:pimeloyl-ACP methyl ester carboxylesterase
MFASASLPTSSTSHDGQPRLHAMRWGSETGGSPVLLLHGQPGHASVWRPVGDALADRGHHALAVDRLGYGRTGGTATGFAGNAHAVLEFLDHHRIERVTVVAHSWASGVALVLAAMAPHRVDGLVLLAPVGAPESVTRIDRILAWPVVGWGAFRAGLRVGGWLLDRDRTRRLLPAGFADLDPVEAKRLAGPARSAAARRSAAVEQRALVTELAQVRGRLDELDVPTMVVTGRRDQIVTPAAARALAARIDGARVREVDAGHLLPADAVGAVVDAVDAVRASPVIDLREAAEVSGRPAPARARSCSSSNGP